MISSRLTISPCRTADLRVLLKALAFSMRRQNQNTVARHLGKAANDLHSLLAQLLRAEAHGTLLKRRGQSHMLREEYHPGFLLQQVSS